MGRRLSSEHPAENFLLERGYVQRRSLPRQAILGCIGCRWITSVQEGKEMQLYGGELAVCTGIQNGGAYHTIQLLAKVGIMRTGWEDLEAKDAGRPLRLYYYPTDSKLGQAFLQALEMPDICNRGSGVSGDT